MIDDCLKVTCYFGERERHRGRFLSDALLDAFEQHRLGTSILLRATAGFGLRHHLRTDTTLTMSEDPSMMAVATDLRVKVEPVLPQLLRIQDRGLLTVERARLVLGDAPVRLPAEHGAATKLTIHLGRREQAGRIPAYVAVCDLLHRQGLAGATTLVGVDGTSHGSRERARFWDRNLAVPAMVLAVGEGDRIEQVLPQLGALLARPAITVERVQVCKRDGELFSRPPALTTEEDGPWQKLMIYTSEHQLSHGEPIHRGIVRRLRATRARGTTVLRGAWGFHGEQPPHGDRLFQLGRRVPVVTVVVDRPEGIAESFAVVDELTTEHGLVTCETVPRLHDAAPCGTSVGAV